MAKSQVTLFDANGDLIIDATDVKWLVSGTETVAASMIGSDTGGSATVVSNGDGTYITDGNYSTYLTSGNLATGTYDIEVGGSVVIEGWSHINPADVAGALLASDNLSNVASASEARSNLGLEIGVDVQAYDSDLTLAADVIGAWAGVGNLYPFLYWNTDEPGFASASTMRTQLGLGSAALLAATGLLNVTVSTDAAPAADSSYLNQIWIRNTSTGYSVKFCVRTGTSTYEWRYLQVSDGASGTEDANYTYGGA